MQRWIAGLFNGHERGAWIATAVIAAVVLLLIRPGAARADAYEQYEQLNAHGKCQIAAELVKVGMILRNEYGEELVDVGGGVKARHAYTFDEVVARRMMETGYTFGSERDRALWEHFARRGWERIDELLAIESERIRREHSKDWNAVINPPKFPPAYIQARFIEGMRKCQQGATPEEVNFVEIGFIKTASGQSLAEIDAMYSRLGYCQQSMSLYQQRCVDQKMRECMNARMHQIHAEAQLHEEAAKCAAALSEDANACKREMAQQTYKCLDLWPRAAAAEQ